jgi:hypothetical protein
MMSECGFISARTKEASAARNAKCDVDGFVVVRAPGFHRQQQTILSVDDRHSTFQRCATTTVLEARKSVYPGGVRRNLIPIAGAKGCYRQEWFTLGREAFSGLATLLCPWFARKIPTISRQCLPSLFLRRQCVNLKSA